MKAPLLILVRIELYVLALEQAVQNVVVSTVLIPSMLLSMVAANLLVAVTLRTEATTIQMIHSWSSLIDAHQAGTVIHVLTALMHPTPASCRRRFPRTLASCMESFDQWPLWHSTVLPAQSRLLSLGFRQGDMNAS